MLCQFLHYSEICLKDRKVFLVEQNAYSQVALAEHIQNWDGGITQAMKKVSSC